MADWQRRSVLRTGTALLAGGLLSSSGTADDLINEDQASLEEPTGWSSYGGNAGNTRYVPSADDLEEPETIAWQYDETGAAAVVDGTVYLQTDGEILQNDGEIHALDADDGCLLWTTGNIQGLTTPAVADEAVFVTGDQLTAIEADSGDIRWCNTFGDNAVSSAPVVAFETVYVVVNGTLYAFDTADGSCCWKRDSVSVTYELPHNDSPSQTSYIFNTRYDSIAATDGAVWALLDDRASEGSINTDAVAAFDPRTGETQWSAHLKPGYYARGLTVTEDTLFIENETERGVMIFDRAEEEHGDFIPDALATATANGRTVTRGRDGLAMYNSRSSWSKDGMHRYGRPTIADETVVVAHSVNGSRVTDEIIGFDLESGSERWRFTFDDAQWSDGFSVDCFVAGETVYINRNDGLTALR
ncbi:MULTISPECIES: outer membrane protein assembly factor BamB family protein [Natrialbaceae]|uniref:outer membrane protein assembly factor BamB family protein n=1 Tax=Natrialbaceae TaxID=1644061 RepID=UPI00207D5568|nr:PQQ-binding-like beta-propeller repeat protein [Natronococcus sp. CG52]